MKAKTLDSVISELKADNDKKIEGAKLVFDAAKKTGIQVDEIIYYSHSNGLGFGWRKPVSKSEVKAIFKAYPISGPNHEMKFASSSNNYTTDSPLVVKWTNYDFFNAKTFKISYPSNDIEISIEVPAEHFKGHTWFRERQGNHLGFGRYERFNDIFIDNFYTQSYSGGSNVFHFLEGAEKLEEYVNFVINGQFSYANEITN